MSEEITNPKSRSRLYAVQSLYAKQIDDSTNLDAVIEALTITEKKGKQKVIKHTQAILEIAVAEQNSIDSIIKVNSSKPKEVPTQNPLVYSILLAALAEMLKFEEVDKRIIISEYLNIAAGFFDRPEISFINAVLDKFSNSSGKQ